MTTNFKTNEVFLLLQEKLKEKYKRNFEMYDGFAYIYHKSMTFFIEAFDDEKPNTFMLVAGLHNIELIDGDTQAYNNEFQTPDMLIETEKDVDEFLYELDFMIKTCDADKRINKIWKAVDKLYELVDDNQYDGDFLCELLYRYFDI